MGITYKQSKEIDAHKDDRATKRRSQFSGIAVCMLLLPREWEGATLECATGYTAELFVGGEGLRAGVLSTHWEPGLSHRFTFSGITSDCLWCVGLFAFWRGGGFCCLCCFFVCCLVFLLSSSEMHNYVILSMTVTIVTMSAAMEQKKYLIFP